MHALEQGLELSLDARRGGKITRLFDVGLGRNLLLSSSQSGRLVLDDGLVFDVSGWDEIIPSIEPCDDVPPMGWAVRTSPRCLAEAGCLVSEWEIPGWRLERSIRVAGSGLTADYGITNRSERPAKVLWAAHVLYPTEGLHEVTLPAGGIIPGPGCDVDEVMRVLARDQDNWHIRTLENAGRSWKFFLPARGAAVLAYGDATLSIATDTAWWGIWINLGRIGRPCIGIEPTNWPSDLLRDVGDSIAGSATVSLSWGLRIAGDRNSRWDGMASCG